MKEKKKKRMQIFMCERIVGEMRSIGERNPKAKE